MPQLILPDSFDKGFKALAERLNSCETTTQSIQTIAVLCNQNIFTIEYNPLKDTQVQDLFFENLKNADNTQVSKIICLMHNGQVDLPSLSFRKALCALDENNANAKILLKSLNGYNTRTISETL